MKDNEIFEPELVIEFPTIDEDTSEGDDPNVEETTEEKIEETTETSVEDNKEKNNESSVDEKPAGDNKPTEVKPTDIDPRIKAHYDYMVDQGLLIVGEDFAFDGSNIEEAYQRDTEMRTNQIAQRLIDSFPERGKEFLNYMLSGGNDLDGFFKINRDIEFNDSYDVSNPDQAKELIVSDLKERGLPDRAIEYAIEGFELSETLEEEATKIKEAKLAQLKQAKLDKIEQEKQASIEARQNAQKYYQKANEYLDTTKWNAKRKNEVLNSLFITQNSGKTQAQEILESIMKSPKSSTILADILLGYDISKDDWSFKRIEDSLKSKVTRNVKDSFDKYLSSSDSAIVRSDADPTDKSNKFSWDNVEIVEKFDDK